MFIWSIQYLCAVCVFRGLRAQEFTPPPYFVLGMFPFSLFLATSHKSILLWTSGEWGLRICLATLNRWHVLHYIQAALLLLLLHSFCVICQKPKSHLNEFGWPVIWILCNKGKCVFEWATCYEEIMFSCIDARQSNA